jgi:superfamily I DNA and/or RNA helicase
MFIDVKDSSERRVDKSYENEAEINVTRTLIELLRANKLSIGVITPYKQQMRRLQSALRQFDNVFTNTIDSFQGQEKDIVIISCVRASKRCSEKSLGFLIDERRINVALTRSKFLLVVIGNADTLGSNEIWDGFLTHVAKQKQYMRLDGEDHSRAALKRLVYG